MKRVIRSSISSELTLDQGRILGLLKQLDSKLRKNEMKG